MMLYQHYKYRGLTFVMTCSVCPEQYDVQDENGKTTGYVRLRHGYLRVDYPYCGGRTIYATAFEDGFKGCFDDDDGQEREKYLDFIASLINFVRSEDESS